MIFSEQPPSKQWVALTYKGEKIAEVWFKPEGEPFALSFRVPQSSFQIRGMAQLLTAENLLGAVAISTADIESWRLGDICHAGMDGSNPELRKPLVPPSHEVAHLTIHVSLKPPPQAAAADEGSESVLLLERWQELVARWNAILGLEATIEGLRQRMESLRSDLEAASRQSLTTEEKVHALNADVAQWNKAKTRAHYGLPKVKEFIHRATWVLGLPERKKLEELFKEPAQAPVSAAEIDNLPQQLEHLLKDRQVLSAHGVTVCQECQGISAEIQGALRTLKNNAAANVRKNLAASRKKGKFI